MADGSPEVPEDLAQVATEKGIPLDLMRRALALGFPAEAVKQQISLPGATAEAAEAFISEQERIRAGGEITVPENLAQAAAKHDWPEALVKRALRLAGGSGQARPRPRRPARRSHHADRVGHPRRPGRALHLPAGAHS